MSTPAKKPAAKPASKPSPAKPTTAKPVAKKPATKPKAKPINLSDLDSVEESKADKELARLLAGGADLPDDLEDDLTEIITDPIDEDDENELDKFEADDVEDDENDVEESDDEDEDSKDEPLEEDKAVDLLEPSALINRLSKETTSESSVAPKVVPTSDSNPVELPPCLDYEDSTENPSGVKLVLEAFAPGCLNCTHLVPTGSDEYTDCHFSKGNTFCPAQSVKIIFTGRRNTFLNKLKVARATSDSNRVLKILASLEKEPMELKNYVLTKAGII